MRILRSQSTSRYASHVFSINRYVAILAILITSPACLSKSHVIPQGELQKLAQTDPQVRGQRVRVLQSFAGQSEPPPAPRVDNGPNVGVVVVDPTPGPVARSTLRGGSAKSAKENAKAWLVIAAAVAVGAALTEGARYDGWVELHPMHPVHLFGWDGRYQWVPLAQLTPELAASAHKAVVRDGEGPWKPLGRAPLNRRGWTYSVLMGSSETPMIDEPGLRGFAAHVQLGRFVTPQMGVLLDFGVGWADNEFGDTVYDSRNSLELQFLPFSASIIHAGLFGQIGMGYRLDDRYHGSDRRGFLLGGGVIGQLELTTRLAITARAAQTMAYGSRTTDVTFGLSIY